MLILALDTFEDLEPVLESHPDAVVIGFDPLSARSRAIARLDQLPELVEFFHDHNIQVLINAQAMVEEKLYPEIQTTFFAALDAGVDGFYIADDGYITMADEYEQKTGKPVRDKLIIQPETLICSGEDASFYLDLGLQAASLGHELSLGEMVDAAHVCTRPDGIEVLIAGLYTWMESRRPLIENYLRYIERSDRFEEGRIYTIQEQLREARLPIWQDEKGTHVLADQPLQAGAHLLDLQKAGIGRFRIDAFLKGNAWGANQLKKYQALMEHPELAESFDIEPTIFVAPSWIRKEKENGRH